MLTTFKDIHPAYCLVEEKYIDEVKSMAALLRHKKTGTVIAVLSNEDKNKVFNIIFRTPPADSTGVAHILEHSVLCGSRHFPVKDPFVELVKGSLNTFLNAMTYPDKTMYPVASCNDKDFQNLMHVYLDSVFYPNIYKHKEIFLQEGWRYELEDAADEMTLNGVVYNEMKGAFSSPDDVLSSKISAALYPDVTYRHESGGDPACIPDLTYEQFLDFHRTYYHPSNAFIYLYGDMDPAEKLDFIDREYLSAFDYLKVDSEIGVQPPFPTMKAQQLTYSVSSDESLEDKTYLAYSMVMKDCPDNLFHVTMQVLDYCLMSCPGAPLKKALIDSGMCKDAYMEYEKALRQPCLSFVMKNSNPQHKDAFLALVKETLAKIVSEGISHDSLKAAINTLEFSFREGDFGWVPSGIMYSIQMMDSWLHDKENPFTHLQCFKTFETLKAMIGTDYYETFITREILENTHAVLTVLAPERGLAARSEAQLKEKLSAYKAGLSAQEINAYVAATKNLKTYQETPSSQEELASIPMLSLEDIDKDPQPLMNEELEIKNFKVLMHDYETSGIAYVRMIFDASGLPAELIPYFGLLDSIYGKVDTSKRGYQDLNNDIHMNTGGIHAYSNLSAGPLTKDGAEYLVTMEFGGKALYAQVPKMFALIREIMQETVFDDKKRLKEIIAATVTKIKAAMDGSGHNFAVARAHSYYSESGAYKEMIAGIDFYQFLCRLEADFETMFAEIVANLEKVSAFIFRRDNVMIDYTGRREGLEKLAAGLDGLFMSLPDKKVEKVPFVFAPENTNEAFITSGMVQYDAVAGNFKAAGFKYHGGLNVLKVIMGYEYLWINIRVKGGAYGCMCGFNRSGSAHFVSYRDPNLKETYDVYDNCAKYLKTFDVSDRDMLKYIIGTISDMDAPKKPAAAGARSLSAYQTKLTWEDLKKTRDEVLSTNVETIRSFADLITAFVGQDHKCTIGSETQIETHRELFNAVKTLQ